MPLDRNELRARIDMTRTSHMLRGSVFRALVNEVEKHLPLEDQRLMHIRKRYDKGALADLFNYPVSDWLEVLWDAADAVEPTYGNQVNALRAMGKAVADSFLSSVVGRLAQSIGANKKPMEMLFHAPAVYASGASYGKRTPIRLDERHGLLKIREDFAPADYHVGMLQQGLSINGHKIQCKAHVYGLCEYDIEVEWLA